MIALKKPTLNRPFKPAIARSSYWVRAPHSGILQPHKGLGKRVQKGELLAKIGNPTNTKEYKLTAPIPGIVIGRSNQPLVHEGAALFHIACFERLALVGEQIEGLQDSFIETHEHLSDA